MVIKARLYLALAESGKRQSDLARHCGVSTAAVALWFKGDGREAISLKHKNIVAVAGFFNTSIEWLEGNGQQTAESMRSAGKPIESPLIDINKNLMDGDRLDVNLSTSSQFDERNPKHAHVQSYELWRGDVATEIRRMSVPLVWLEQEGLDVGKLVTIEMPDDSQDGLVGRGYIIAVNTNWSGKLRDGLHYAIDIGGTPTIRRADFEYNDDLVLSCLNSKHKDQPVAKESIGTLNIIGVAVRFQGDFPKIK